MEKFIHIHAKCNAFEIFEQVPEKKAELRLKKIRNNFIWSQSRSNFKDDHLVVKTIVVNPELPLR